MKFVQHNDLTLSYETYGQGNEHVLCFHGHGKSSEDYKFLETKNRKIIAVNLFLHGASTINEDRIEKNPITPCELKTLIEKLLKQENTNQFHLIAYSQGGRFGLCIIPYFIRSIKSIHLMAIDGMNNNNIYSWTQRRWWTRKIFKTWSNKPQKLTKIATFLAKIKIIDKKLLEFLNYYTEDKKRITLGYKAWVAFRKLIPNYKLLKKVLKEHPVPFHFLIGENDKIITLSSAKKFLSKIDKSDSLTLLPFGHDLFKPEAKEYLKKVVVLGRIEARG